MTKRNLSVRLWTFVSVILAFRCTVSSGVTSGVTASDHISYVRVPSYEAVTACQYTMTARIRLLLFWISRQGVGGGRIAWSEETNGNQAVELLIGSDPERAPMRINRWGYIIERVTGSSSELVGLMTESEEHSVEQARAAVTRVGGSHSFKGIRGSMTGDLAQSTTMRLLLADDFTFRDASTLLRQLPQNGTPIRQIRVPNGTAPGFLFALKGLVHDSVENSRISGRADTGGNTSRRFVYAGSLYELTQRSTRLVKEDTVNGHTYQGVIKSEFESHNLKTGELSRFSIAYGSQPPFTETPIRIVYRPRWWFEVELLLASEPEAMEAAGRETAWNLGAK
jgi:hypothetical protein